jgi:hypothetical protein
MTEDAGEHMGAVIDLLSRLARRQQPEGPMPIGMIADFMTGAGDGTDDLWVLLGLLANDKKRGWRTKLRQNGEDAWRKHRVGAVVKRQRDGTPVLRTAAHCPLAVGG